MAKYRAMQTSGPGRDFELVEREIPTPEGDDILIKVEACGICHSDQYCREGMWPGLQFPRVPGHEVIGRVEKAGPGVTMWKPGQRVGVGWHAGHCFTCDACRHGDFINCANGVITGLGRDGGYAEYMTASQHAAALVPDELDSYEAAPLLCAGITVYNALRNSKARAGDTVAIQGIGGLGHLAVQFSRRMGFRTVALSHGESKRKLALELGAHHYIDTSSDKAVEELQKLGGAKVILATAPYSDAMSAVFDGLGRNGEMIVVGASPDPIKVSPFQLLPNRKSLRGWASGSAMDSEETLNFSGLAGVHTQVEKYPLEKANEAYERMITNKARFRVVLEMN